jgi:glutamate racemase
VIGVYDSGLGGLTVVAALRRAGISDEVVYFADQAHVPYGDKSDAELQSLLRDNLAWLAARGVDVVAMGCNTSCAVASRVGWPEHRFVHPIQDLIGNGARAFAAAPYRRVAVIATAATVRSGAYARAIREIAPDVEVTEIAAPEFVPLVESGRAETDEAHGAVARTVAQLPPGTEAIVYGCTHYPLLDAHFAALVPHLTRIDPAEQQAAAVLALPLPLGTSRTTYVTNGDPVLFEQNVRRWTGDTTGIVTGLIATGFEGGGRPAGAQTRAGDARVFASVRKRYCLKIRSRLPGSANF